MAKRSKNIYRNGLAVSEKTERLRRAHDFIQLLKVFTVTQKDPAKGEDSLLLDRVYSEPSNAFLFKPASLTEIKDACLIFIDTNVLLLPYGTGKDSLNSIKDVYKRLVDANRLFIPDRVMQEFEKNVPDQLKSLFHSVSLAQNVNPPSLQFPLLEGVEEYRDLLEKDEKLRTAVGEYRKSVKATLSAIEEWNHDDPVRTMYRGIFTSKQAAPITSMSPEKLLAEWTYRLANRLPPGYKDSTKDDTGIGDYLVWQSILDKCGNSKSHAIFVTGESKPDWWHKSHEQPLYARRELVEEFRRATGGKTIRLVSAAKFFSLFGASQEAVEEIQVEEQKSPASLQIEGEEGDFLSVAFASANNWIGKRYKGCKISRHMYSRSMSSYAVRSPSGDTRFIFFAPIQNSLDTSKFAHLYREAFTMHGGKNTILFYILPDVAEAMNAKILAVPRLHAREGRVAVGYLDNRFGLHEIDFPFDDMAANAEEGLI